MSGLHTMLEQSVRERAEKESSVANGVVTPEEIVRHAEMLSEYFSDQRKDVFLSITGDTQNKTPDSVTFIASLVRTHSTQKNES